MAGENGVKNIQAAAYNVMPTVTIKLGNERVMPWKPVVGVVFGRLFTFLPPMRASQLRPID